MPLLPKCRRKLANGCHEPYDSRLHFVCVRCVALHLRDDQLRIKFRKKGQRGQVPEWAVGTHVVKTKTGRFRTLRAFGYEDIKTRLS